MVFKNISAEFLEDTVILVSIVQRHDIALASSNNPRIHISIFHEYYYFIN